MEPQVTNDKAHRQALPRPPAEAVRAAVCLLPGGGGAITAQVLNSQRLSLSQRVWHCLHSLMN